MKLNNETIRTAVKEWLDNSNEAESKYGHISNWDVSNVTDMRNMFSANLAFNQDIGEWDVSNVNNMQGMFWADQISSSFNQDLSMWDVSNEPLCDNFCLGNTQWTLPKPNFTTNCCF